MNDQLDRAVRTVLADIIATAPERDDQPIHTVTVDSLEAGRRRPYLMVAAAALAVVGVSGLAIVTNQHAGTTPTSAPTASTPLASDPTASDRPSASPLGPLLPTELEADAIPLVTPGGSGWELTNADAVSGSPVTGGFEGATVFVGDGPTYDAPLFAATVVDTTPAPDGTPVTVAPIETLLAEGEPVQVAGTTGAATVTDTDGDTGLTGPIVTMFWPLEANRYARVNAVRLTVEEVVAFANQLTLTNGRLTMSTPTGYRELTAPTPGTRRHISYRFTNAGREIEVIGENRGVASLLGRIAGEVRTTRVVNGVEIAYRPQPNQSGEYWADWQSGDWSFYAIASGLPTEDDFFSELASITLTDSATFEATGAAIGIVMPGVHNDLAGQALDAVGLDAAAFADAATTELPMSADSYGFELIKGAACVWHDRLSKAGDESAQQTLATDIERTIEASRGTDFERAADLILIPLLDTVSGRQPSVENDYTGCPGWATAG